MSDKHSFIPAHGGYKHLLSFSDPAICANVIIGLIKVTRYLLDRQIRHLERTFLNEGGLRERMTRARLKHRNLEKS